MRKHALSHRLSCAKEVIKVVPRPVPRPYMDVGLLILKQLVNYFKILPLLFEKEIKLC